LAAPSPKSEEFSSPGKKSSSPFSIAIRNFHLDPERGMLEPLKSARIAIKSAFLSPRPK
jgi:hypothetical protein